MVWAFLTRSGGETDLIEELGRSTRAKQLSEGVVLALERPRGGDSELKELAFARQAMRSCAELPLDREALLQGAAELLQDTLRERPHPWTLQRVVPDSKDPKDPRRKTSARLFQTRAASPPAREGRDERTDEGTDESTDERKDGRIDERSSHGLESFDDRRDPFLETLLESLPKRLREAHVHSSSDATFFLQIWIVDNKRVLCGITSRKHALSPHPGGRLQLKRPQDAPSRAGFKLEEAIDWLGGIGPSKGDLCADLGAAPGGWSKVAVERGAKVIAVDPARIKIALPPKVFTHVKASAFDFSPPETLDWLLCDMAWRPMEVAKLIAKWGRRAWAQQLIANFKLPMRQKAKILTEILTILEANGWRGLRARQLYYDRDEVTVFGWLDPALVQRGALAPFQFRAAAKYTSKTRKTTNAKMGATNKKKAPARSGSPQRSPKGPRKKRKASAKPRP